MFAPINGKKKKSEILENITTWIVKKTNFCANKLNKKGAKSGKIGNKYTNFCTNKYEKEKKSEVRSGLCWLFSDQNSARGPNWNLLRDLYSFWGREHIEGFKKQGKEMAGFLAITAPLALCGFLFLAPFCFLFICFWS